VRVASTISPQALRHTYESTIDRKHFFGFNILPTVPPDTQVLRRRNASALRNNADCAVHFASGGTELERVTCLE
jgi:hypothetical protein